MADWYVSSAAFAAVTAFAASHAYSVGDFVKATAPAAGKEYVWRCTTAGTSATEPTWSTAYANNQTITSGGATFTNVTGQSAYGWNAAAGTLYSIANANSNRPAAGDRVFLSSDHTETISGTITYGFNSNTPAFGLLQVISVSRAGSVPPIAADITTGAAITVAAANLAATTFDALCNMYWQGVTFSHAGSAGAATWIFNSTGNKTQYYKDCAFRLATSGNDRLSASTASARVIFDNTTVQFGTTAQSIGGSAGSFSFEFIWLNTPSAIVGATLPTTLFNPGTQAAELFTCRGVDLSAVTGTLLGMSTGSSTKALFDSCRIASSAPRVPASPANGTPSVTELDLVNCYDGTNVINERYTEVGAITTDRSTYLTGGAQDDVGNYSLKMVSSTRSDFAVLPLDCFAIDVENTVTGTSKTATVEIISSGTLNNNDIRLLLEYMGTSGNPVASFGDSLATILTAASALSSSSSTWNSPPGTPQKQLLQVTFTPQRAGRVRGLVRLGKASTTVWINPQIVIT